MNMVAPAQSRPSDLRQALARHFDNAPASSALRAEMDTPDMQERLARFDAADATALQEQGSYRRFGRFALWAMLAGTVAGALVLLPPVYGTHGTRSVLEALQGLAMILTFIAVFWIGLRKPVGEWMHSRAEAESIRADAFRAMVRLGIDRKELLAPALACFKDAHLDWQLAFYKRRGPQHRKAAGHTTPYRMVGYLLLVVALLLGFAGLANLAAEFGWTGPAALVQWIPLERPGSWQLGFGAMASSVLAFASARSFMDQNERNASCYSLAAAQLETIARKDLPSAVAAADAGDLAEVLAFCEKVQSVLSAEHGAWLYARPSENIMSTPKPNF